MSSIHMGYVVAAKPKQTSSSAVLFCPFCRESFEGETECPDHELTLVEFSALPKQAHERTQPGWDEMVGLYDPRFGRGWLAAGAATILLAFFLPLVHATYEGELHTFTGFQAALGPAANLWTVPFVGAMFLYFFLVRRRTPIRMRGARMAGLALSFMPVLSLIYSLRNIRSGVAGAHGAVSLELGVGVWVVVAASVLLLVGSLRFGNLKIEGLPHGAEAEADEKKIDFDS